MAGPQPLALQLEQLLNPRPREADPEADPEEGEAAGHKATCRAVGPAPADPGREWGRHPDSSVEENCLPERCRAPGDGGGFGRALQTWCSGGRSGPRPGARLLGLGAAAGSRRRGQAGS